MKTIILIIVMTLSGVALIAQRPGPGTGLRPESRERIEAHRVAFITQKLELTPEEAARFWPLYNEHKEEMKKLRDDIERPDLLTVTDDEANVIIERHLQMEQKKMDLKRNLYTRLRPVISSRKILMLHAAEREFNKELLRRANEYRKN